MLAWEGTHSTLNHHTSHTLLPTPCNPITLLTNLTSLKKGIRQKGNQKDKTGQTPPKAKTGTPNTNLPRTSLSRPSKLHFYCHFHGWVTTHGWPSGQEDTMVIRASS